MTEHDPETGAMKATSSELKSLLEKNPLRVSYQDGNIEHLCLAAIEDIAVINIKRGILSVFQNNMDDITKSQKVPEVSTLVVFDVAVLTQRQTVHNLLSYNLMFQRDFVLLINLLDCSCRLVGVVNNIIGLHM